MVPDYGAGINEGLWEKLAPVLDLVILNMALDHCHINLPLTNRANDAHPERFSRDSAFPFHLFAPSSLSWLTGLVLRSCASSISTLLFSFILMAFCGVILHLFYLHQSLLSHLGPVLSKDPQTEDPTGATLGIRPGQRTDRGRRLRGTLTE